jgi:hypothetical protein
MAIQSWELFKALCTRFAYSRLLQTGNFELKTREST